MVHSGSFLNRSLSVSLPVQNDKNTKQENEQQSEPEVHEPPTSTEPEVNRTLLEEIKIILVENKNLEIKIEKIEKNKKEFGYQQAKIVQKLKERQNLFPQKTKLLEVRIDFFFQILFFF